MQQSHLTRIFSIDQLVPVCASLPVAVPDTKVIVESVGVFLLSGVIMASKLELTTSNSNTIGANLTGINLIVALNLIKV